MVYFASSNSEPRMSLEGQKPDPCRNGRSRTSPAPPDIPAHARSAALCHEPDVSRCSKNSLDDLVSECEQRRWKRQAERLGGRQIDHEIELVGCSTGMSARLRPAQYLVGNVRGAPKQIRKVRSVGHQTSRLGECPKAVYGRPSHAQRQAINSNPIGRQKWSEEHT